MLGFLTSMFCSQCSHLLRGIGAVFKTQTTSDAEEADPKEHLSAEEQLLNQIEHNKQVYERLQLYDADKQRLLFVCGNGKTGVCIGSDKKLYSCKKSFQTKLTTQVVKRFRKAQEGVSGNELLKHVTGILTKYLYFEDKRIYLFEAVWITGTYFYAMFSHYGYLFKYSRKYRSGKTRNLEICSQLAYEASEPLNAPTPASMKRNSFRRRDCRVRHTRALETEGILWGCNGNA